MSFITKRGAVNKLAKKPKAGEENVKTNSCAPDEHTKAESEQSVCEDECQGDKKLYEELEKKYNELEDKYLRLAAEYTNFQRRTREEKEALYTNAVCDTVAELLPVMDNLQRANDTMSEAADAKSIAQGVAMITKMTLEVFSKLGVEPIEAMGKEFDASLHNAVMHIDDESFGTNEVVEEFQKGYKCKDKVIRYSMVKVAN